MALPRYRKHELLMIAEEIGISVSGKPTVYSLRDAIESSDIFKNEREQFDLVAETVIEELESLRVREESQLEIEKQKTTNNLESLNLENLIKSVKTLSIPLPTRPESFNLFFQTIERAFETKKVPENLKAEILLNILGEKATNLLVYLSAEDLKDYFKLKETVLKEFQCSPQEVLNNFRKAQKFPNETYTQFATRLCATFDYYCQLRKVEDFKTLCDLTISDKLYSALDSELKGHIGVLQGETWYRPSEMARSCDIYMTSRGKANKGDIQATRNQYVPNNKFKYPSKSLVSGVKGRKCVICTTNNNHYLNMCPNFKTMTVGERIEVVKKQQLCFNCLNPHRVSSCQSKYSCSKCKKRHNTLLHFDERPTPVTGNTAEPAASANTAITAIPCSSRSDQVDCEPTQQVFTGTSSNALYNKTVVLSTAVVYVTDSFGKFHPCRVLIDSGSQSNFMTVECSEALAVQRKRTNVLISCLGGSEVNVKASVDATISNFEGNFSRTLSFLVVPKITDFTPPKRLKLPFLNLPKDLRLADPNFHNPGRVDLLLGAECFFEFLRSGTVKLGNSHLSAQNTVFGYVIGGSFRESSQGKLSSNFCGFTRDVEDLGSILKGFWEIESVSDYSPTDNRKDEDLKCEEHFLGTHSRDATGRYVVRLPFSAPTSDLGNSRDLALQRFKSVERKLLAKPEVYQQYKDFITEYSELGHMERVPALKSSPQGTFYLPHHAVFKSNDSTGKIRVVFDASAKSDSGKSLNDILMTGPRIQNDLFPILLRFRCHQVAVVADVEKMFRQFRLHEEDCDFQRILWRDHPSKPIEEYRLKTVTYGLGCSPFLSSRALQQLAVDEKKQFPRASRVVLQDCYVDDLLTGGNSDRDAMELSSQLMKMMKRGGLTLRKWCSNSPNLLQAIPEEFREDKSHIEFNREKSIKVLGVNWQPGTDTFTINVNRPDALRSINKRSVLSTIAGLFDPLGLLGPVVVKAKIFMQSLWKISVSWDDDLPIEMQSVWKRFASTLVCMTEVHVPRMVLVESPTNIKIVGFCDASKEAYGAVIYLQSTNVAGDMKVSLLCSKSRVAPIKELTIPRLELCGAELLAKLAAKVVDTLRISLNNIELYCDSTTVLAWINSCPSTLKVYVANRVAKIKEFSKNFSWHYVRSEDNPADHVSRGVWPDQIANIDIWWNGPEFLYKDSSPPHSVSEPSAEYSDELQISSDTSRVTALPTAVNSETVDLLNRFSSFSKLKRITAYCLRFINNCKRPQQRSAGFLTTRELESASLLWVKIVQLLAFRDEISSLSKNKPISCSSKILTLNPFLDDQGVLRVGGRLRHAEVAFSVKHPMLLPKNHLLTELIVRHYHLSSLHAGPQLVQSLLRERFWVVNARDVIRLIIRKCVVCCRFRAKSVNQLMGDLPPSRVTPFPAFVKCGVDYAGPFQVKLSKGRGYRTVKVYIALFICFVTKAIHLELVTDLTSDAFIAALKRFFSRRGKCQDIYSDCGTNFIGAKRKLDEFKQFLSSSIHEKISNFLSDIGISWHFNPPGSPHMGGLWEAGVKSTKYHLKRVVGDLNLTYEEFETLLTQIEACLNSRPITQMSGDPNDLNALTPGHFLIGRPLSVLPEPDYLDKKVCYLSRWQLMQRTLQQFWRRWSNEYLTNLQQRPKWLRECKNIEKGNLVLLMEDSISPAEWRLARVIDIHPGNDGLVRVVTLKTAKGMFKRNVSKICKLPI